MEKILFKSKVSILENIRYFLFVALITYLIVNLKDNSFIIVNKISSQFFNYNFNMENFNNFTNILLIFLFVFLLYRIIYTVTKKYEFTENRLIMKKGILNRKTDYIELFRIKDLEISEPILMRMFFSCNVLFYTTDKSHPKLKVSYMKNFKKNELILRNQIEKIVNTGRGREVDVA